TTAINDGTVTITGARSYGDNVSMRAARSLTGVGDMFTGTVTGAQTLSIVDSGTTTFSSPVSVATLTTNAGGTTAINGGTVTTTRAEGRGERDGRGAATKRTGGGRTVTGTVRCGQTRT